MVREGKIERLRDQPTAFLLGQYPSLASLLSLTRGSDFINIITAIPLLIFSFNGSNESSASGTNLCKNEGRKQKVMMKTFHLSSCNFFPLPSHTAHSPIQVRASGVAHTKKERDRFLAPLKGLLTFQRSLESHHLQIR